MHPQAPNLVTLILLMPLLGSIAIACLPDNVSRKLALFFSGLMVAASGLCAFQFKANDPGMQFTNQINWFTQPFLVQYHVGVDGLSLSLVVLTTVVVLLAVMASDRITNRVKFYYSMVMLLTFSILGVFVSLDLLQFFVLYELELVPMYFLIAVWGGPRRDYAAMKFLIYTFFGGVLMLAGLLFMYNQLGIDNPMQMSMDMMLLAERCPLLPRSVQALACLGFFLAFIIKLPSFPFHTWLPDAHVEAPTPISMILAALLLKMGSYGLVRICLGLFPQFFVDYGYLIIALGSFNVIWAAMACLVQTDMKRIIAFSSVSHMGFVLIGIAALSSAALNGAIFQMISHGLISAALFFMVGTVYERCHTRNLIEIGGGLAKQMPFIFYFWMFAALANLGLPGMSGFVAETAVLYGAFTSAFIHSSVYVGFMQGWIYFACFGVVLTAGYMLWLLKRLFYGPEQSKWAGHLSDMTANEKLIGSALAAMILLLGIYPYMLTSIYQPVSDSMTVRTSELPKSDQNGNIGMLQDKAVH